MLFEWDFFLLIYLIFFKIFSIIGTSWTTALKELTEHYAQREASCPVLKQVVLENLKKIRNEKIDEQIKVKQILLHFFFYFGIIDFIV